MLITKHVQSTVTVVAGDQSILIDPGTYNFEEGRYTYEDFDSVDILVVTHGHADHFDVDAVKSIVSRCACQILTVDEVAETLHEAGIDADVLNVGQQVDIGAIALTAVDTDHVIRGETVDAFGVLIDTPSGSLYHASDTMYLDEKPYADVVLVPINNRGVSMGIEDASRFIRDIGPQVAVPIHYDSPRDRGRVDPQEFADLLRESGINVRILDIGETFEFRR
jgi:L-ascorbate metabolism protein UlaG (beta-lactamase superfamily)